MALHHADHLAAHINETAAKIDGVYRAARPLNYQLDSVFDRLKWAWWVFRGKVDVIKWYKQ